MIESPLYLSMKPKFMRMIGLIQLKYALIKRKLSPGPSCSDSEVKEMISENRMHISVWTWSPSWTSRMLSRSRSVKNSRGTNDE